MLKTLGNAVRLIPLLALAPSAFADDTITVEPLIAKTSYCSIANRELILWITLAAKYKNGLEAPIILSFPSRVAGYALFGNEEGLKTNRPLRNVIPQFPAMFDPSKLDQSQPDPKVFEIIQPGGVAQRLYNVHFVVGGPRVRPIPAGDYFLLVTVDPWPADRKSGEKLARSWNVRGSLWMDSITLPPVRLHIDATSVKWEPCPLRVD